MIKDYANRVMDYEYNAFMTLMNVSVSKHLFDEHFTVLWANDYFYQLIGYEKEEYEALFHNHVDEYYKDDPESVAFMAKVIMDAYKNNEPGYEFECPMHTKSGNTVWIRVTGRFTDESFKGIPVIYTIYTDITKLKEMQQLLENQSLELSSALAMAERANRAKSDFLSQMSHDIRTPMNAIIGMTNIATMHLGDTKKVQDCLKKIAASSQHLLGLINDVLDMSKIESGNMVLNPERASLPTVLENVVSIMQPMFKNKSQHFSIRLKQVHHEDFICDTLRLRQIFINILSNASKFTAEQGSIIFEIEELACDLSEHALLQFTFIDTGTGIQPEFLPHIFDVFTRERDSRVDKTEGSGLGMAITKKLTEILGGTIHVESEPGKGTAFQVRLPMKIVAGTPTPTPCGGLKVLVVDDDEIGCKYLVQTLKELQMDAFWVRNDKDALKKISEVQGTGQDFDIVLLDWQMPDMDGLQTAQAIRTTLDNQLPILVTSAYDWSEIEDQAVQMGINGFMQKPLFKTTLCKEMQNCLLGRQPLPQMKSFPNLHGKRLLLVEDNALNLEIAEELLQSMGASVDIAQNGAVGIAQFQQSAQGYYDMILMDIQMPVMNGYEATRQIRALPRPDAARVPIIAITADAFAEDVEATKQAGMNGHLTKPFDMGALTKIIDRYL